MDAREPLVRPDVAARVIVAVALGALVALACSSAPLSTPVPLVCALVGVGGIVLVLAHDRAARVYSARPATPEHRTPARHRAPVPLGDVPTTVLPAVPAVRRPVAGSR